MHKPSACDLLIKDASIVDGTGTRAVIGDVAVTADRIVAVGDCEGLSAHTIIDAHGLTLCPGFIDTHTHDDQLLLADPSMQAKVSQGVTTVVIGNCGVSLAPLEPREVPSPMIEMGGHDVFVYPSFADYIATLKRTPASVNVACLVGHTTLRVGAMASLDRVATDAELEAMKDGAREALSAGAIGLSSGLFYPPAQAADWKEVAELAKLVGEAGGVYATHLRDESDNVIAAIDEACAIAAYADTPLIVSHHKVAGVANFGRAKETLRHLTKAATKQPVSFDVYPYIAGSSMLSETIWAMAARTVITRSEPHPEAAGRDLADIAAEMGISEPEAIKQLIPGGAIYFLMDEADVQQILSHPEAMIGSDGIASDHPHPRLWGTFPRVLGHYVRDVRLFSLEEAVRRMTSLPASRFGFADRGIVAPGAFADLVLIDANEIADTATFEHPQQPSRSVHQVYVNGQCVWNGKQATAERPGAVLRRAGMAKTDNLAY
jgi:N-acyl-D-amino-acid deacylase